MKYNTKRKEIIRARRRKILIAALDGKCVVCGGVEDLEFDHVDPITKQFAISEGLDYPWPRLIAELLKCQLLCHEHHLEKSKQEGSLGAVGHGEGLTGKKSCRCALCNPLKREYMRRYMQERRKK